MFSKLISDFQQVKLSTDDQEPNLFKICGFPHFELVASNVLAFFLDSTEKHGFKDLFLRSLLEAANIDFSRFDLETSIERESRTDNGGFIDVFLFNDTLAIAIENKIFAGLSNDLKDYLNHAEKKSNSAFVIVLSIYEEKVNGRAMHNVTYSQLFSSIRRNMGDYIGFGNLKYVALMTDFIRNIEELARGEINMNEEFLKFIRANNETVQKIGKELKSFHDSLRRLVYEVNSSVLENTNGSSLKQWSWRDLPELFDVAVSDFTLSTGQNIAVNSMIDINNWSFEIFVRKENGNQLDIKSFLESKGFEGRLENNRYVLYEKLPFESKAKDVGLKISQIIKQIQAEQVR